MIQQHPSIIYTSKVRSLDQSNSYRVLSTIAEGLTVIDEKKLKSFTDETLTGKKIKFYSAEYDCYVFILPLVGAVDFALYNDQKEFIHVNQLFVFKIKKGETYTISNPYDEELINFLQFKISPEKFDITFQKEEFNIDDKGGLLNLYQGIDLSVSIGMFNSRDECLYTLKNYRNQIFGFVINGAFEFQNRLLESKDGLLIWDIEEIEFEALCDNAILLLLEF